MTSVSRYPAGVKRTSSLESVHMYLLKFTYTWINSQDSSLRCPGGGEVAWRQACALTCALHGWSYFRYQFSLRQTCQYRTIQRDSSWPIRSSKTPKNLLDWSGTSLLLEARKSKWREGLLFDTKWWILETNSPILKSIQAKAKSNSTTQWKESE